MDLQNREERGCHDAGELGAYPLFFYEAMDFLPVWQRHADCKSYCSNPSACRIIEVATM
jgi:hypothetical protein